MEPEVLRMDQQTLQAPRLHQGPDGEPLIRWDGRYISRVEVLVVIQHALRCEAITADDLEHLSILARPDEHPDR